MQLIGDNLGLFAAGLAWTFRLAVVTLLISTVISALIGTLSATRSRAARALALIYVEVFRDIPLLVNVLFVFFGAPLLGIPLEPFGAATISFSLWGGANGAEIVRGGFNAVPRHQLESAAALGLKPWEIYLFVLAPQALLPMLPPFAGLFTLLVQATSLASLVGVPELFRIGQIVIERTTMMSGHSPAFVIYGGLLITYYVICSVLTAGTRWLERRIANRTRRASSAPAVVAELRPQESV